MQRVTSVRRNAARMFAAACLMAGGAGGPSLAAPVDWRALTETDLRAAARDTGEEYIYAAYPNAKAFRRVLNHRLRTGLSELRLVSNEAGYRAVLQQFAVGFHDEHLYLQFERPDDTARWPGFYARFLNGSVVVAGSRNPAVPDGAAVTACDGRSVDAWIKAIAGNEIGVPTALETTRMAAALRLFVDRGSPLRARPSRCLIDGREVALQWFAAPLDKIGPEMSRLRGRRSAVVSTTAVGVDGAWVRLGYFGPSSVEQADAFRRVVAEAEGLRDRRFIVLDVRGNGGGPYNWFMAYLRGLYGQPYADYYATARLRIRGVYRLTPRTIAADAVSATQNDALVQPADPPFEVWHTADDAARARAIAAGASIFRAASIPIHRDALAPRNLVRARVVVLTDYGCASACIGFVDELKQFPGVVQIGLPTFVDSQSGTALPVQLPSGRARLWVASMTRDGRLRADNVAQEPSIRFAGDITDEAAVERWVLGVMAR